MSGWIKCSDRLPSVAPDTKVKYEEPNLLLCCRWENGDTTIEKGWYSDLVKKCDPRFFTTWITDIYSLNTFKTDSPKVTHWMPLPKLPNNETSM